MENVDPKSWRRRPVPWILPQTSGEEAGTEVSDTSQKNTRNVSFRDVSALSRSCSIRATGGKGSSARVTSHVTSHVMSHATSQVTSHVTSHISYHISQLTSHVSRLTSRLTLRLTSRLTSHLMSHLASHLSSLTSRLAPYATCRMTSHVTCHVQEVPDAARTLELTFKFAEQRGKVVAPPHPKANTPRNTMQNDRTQGTKRLK